MRLAITLVALAVAVGAMSAVAGTAAKDPLKLVLQKSDFPSGATYESKDADYTNFKHRLEAGGVSFEEASFHGQSYSSAKGSLQVTGTVFVTPSVAQAKKGFAVMKSPREIYWIGSDSPLALPSYGDQQHARLSPPAARASGSWRLSSASARRSGR